MKKKTRAFNIFVIAVTLVLLVISLFPFYYMVVQSFTAWDTVDKTLVPTNLTLRSYEYLIGRGGATNSMMWVRALLNSLLVSFPTAVISVAIGLAIGAFQAYWIAYVRPSATRCPSWASAAKNSS